MDHKSSKKGFFRRKSKTIMGLFVAFIFLFSTIAYIYQITPSSSSDNDIYLDSTNKMYYIYKDKNNYEFKINVNNAPSSVENLYNEKIDFENINEYEIGYYSNQTDIIKEYNKLAKPLKDLQAKLGIVEKITSIKCFGNCSLQKISCNSTNISKLSIIVKESDTYNYYIENNCHFFETSNISKTIDYLIYRNALKIN